MDTVHQGPKYPKIKVQLFDLDGNVFSIIGRVTHAMRKSGVADSEIKTFQAEILSSGTYDRALQTCLRWVECS
jgi:hypothetical protein